MADPMDFFNLYVVGSAQLLLEFCFFVRFLHKKIKLYYYFLFTACALAVIHFVPTGNLADFGACLLLLSAGGILICRSDWKSAVLYAALAMEIMQLCFGIINSLSSALYPLLTGFDRNAVGIALMLAGSAASLLLTGFFYCVVDRHFSFCETAEKRYPFLVLIPVLMIFIMDEYINSFIYGLVVTDEIGVYVPVNHSQMLVMQLLGMASLFCILFAYKKLLQSFRLATKLSLLEQEEHSLCQYVEEAKARYEKTKAFRHDIKNHITVIKSLLENGNAKQALDYMGDMEDITQELSFPCSTNNPAVDILVSNKLGVAKSMGIDALCSLTLPYPCGLRDMDVCIILSNALDNAIHACKNMAENADKHIHVTGRVQGDFLFLEIENSFPGKGPLKKGTGLSNIKAVTEKYHGAMSIKTTGASFILNVLLIIS